MRASLVVIAKAPRPGRAKTRLCPPCSPVEAAAIAEAALLETLRAVARVPVARRVLALDGAAGDWLPDGFDVVPQRGDGLGERLAAAFVDVGGPALLIGMDTPQVGWRRLEDGLRALVRPGVDAVLGRARDGGWWALGLRRPDPAVFRGVPMSAATTGAVQRARLRGLGLRTVELPALRDVDRFADAQAVAAEIPGTRFAAAVAGVRAGAVEVPA